MPPGVLDGDAEAHPLLLALLEAAPLAVDSTEALAEVSGEDEVDPHALADAEALGEGGGVPLREAAPLPLGGAVALAEGEGGTLPLPPVLSLAGALGVPCAALPDGVLVPSGDAEALGEGRAQGVAAPLLEGAPVSEAPPVELPSWVAEASKLEVAAALCERGALPVGGSVAVSLPLGAALVLLLLLATPLADTEADPVGAPVPVTLRVARTECEGDAVAAAEPLRPPVGD